MRRALVTGAASGIGAATVERLRRDGWEVVGADRAEADVRDEAAVAALVEAAQPLDLVVACAGVQLHGRDAPAAELDLDAWRETLDVNLTGAFLTAKHALRALGRGGCLVVVASAAGVAPVARHYHAYTASKAGLVGLVQVLAVDYAGAGIRVNAVLPGFVETPLVARVTADEGWLANVVAGVPLGRPGTAAEVADAIAYLADAEFVTGALLRVDGGMTGA